MHSSSLGHKEAGAGSEIEKPTAAAMRKEASPARAARHAKQNRATSQRACRRRGSRGSEPEADDANVELRLPLSRQSAREPGLGPQPVAAILGCACFRFTELPRPETVVGPVSTARFRFAISANVGRQPLNESDIATEAVSQRCAVFSGTQSGGSWRPSTHMQNENGGR